MAEDKISEILATIAEYAKVYAKLEDFQKETDSLFPKHGDQKTGIIGEFYIYQYLKGKKDLKYSVHGKSWDIEYTGNDGETIKIQVKTVLTGFSKTNTLSPIKKGWNFIYFLSLDKNFKPNGFWINEFDESIFKNREIIQSARIKDPANNKSKGTEVFNFDEQNNLVEELLIKIGLGK